MKTLYKLLKSNTHSEIVGIVDKFNTGFYARVDDDLFTVFYPNIETKNELMPCIVSHTDTVSESKPKHITNNNGVLTNKDGVLGADDRAGVYAITRLMGANTKAIFILTDLEEVGGVGAGACADSDIFKKLVPNISALIELDRRGASDIATYGYDNRELIGMFEKLGYKEAYGSYTDVCTLANKSDISCINLSIGYYSEHTKNESLNINEMNRTINNLLYNMPLELYLRVYTVENNFSRYDYYIEDEYEDTRLLCDYCQEHKPLYDNVYGYYCAECLEDINNE